MIEAGWPAGQVARFGPAKLFLVFEQWRERTIRRRLETLIDATAAAVGGRAAERRFSQLEKQLKQVCTSTANESEEQTESNMPLSAADFERMMKEQS